MNVLPWTNPMAFTKDFVSPFIETELITFGRKCWEISSRLEMWSENLFFVVASDATAERARGRLGLVQELPGGNVCLKKLKRALPSVVAFGWVCLWFCLPRWWKVWDTEEGDGEDRVGEDRGTSRDRHPASTLPSALECAVTFPYCWPRCQSHGKWAILAARLLFWATTLESGFSRTLPPALFCPLYFPEQRRGDYRDKILGLGGINQHIQRDGFHSLWLYQLKEMCLGFSAPCMRIHFGSFYFWTDICAIWSAVFLPVQMCGCCPVKCSLYQSLSLRFCLGRGKAAKNNSRTGICRPAPVLLNAIRATWRKRVLAG